MALNLTPLVKTLSIKTKRQEIIPLQPNWAQQVILDKISENHTANKPSRFIILKARQIGISTIAEAILFSWAVFFPRTNAVVVAHDAPSSENLFNMTKLMYEEWPHKKMFPTKYATRRQLSFQSTDSNLWVMTAEHAEAGRSRTIHAMHGSELGFWRSPAEAMLAFNQAIPRTRQSVVMLESTANGVGNWFEQAWTRASAGESDYTPLFFPWYSHPEYIPSEGEKCSDGTCEQCVKESRIKPKDSEEADLIKLGCDLPHLAWRRWAIPNLCDGVLDKWNQEYPDTPEIAFVTRGFNAFPEPYLKACYEPLTPGIGRLEADGMGAVRFVPDRHGPLRMYRQPSQDKKWGQYFIGADPSHGQIHGDSAAAQVINRHNKEQVAVWHGQVNPLDFADELAKLGRFYNGAMVSVEIEGPGYGTVGRLSNIYPNIWSHRVPDRIPGRQISPSVLGFSTSWKRKTWAISKLAETIEKQLLIIHDPMTYGELRAYTYLGEKGFGDVYGPGMEGMGDDLVMSLAICILCESTEPAPDEYNQRAPKPGEIIYGEKIDWGETSDW